MPHGSLAEIACHHNPCQQYVFGQRNSTSFSSADDAQTPFSHGCKGKQCGPSYTRRSLNSFLTSFPEDAFIRPTNSSQGPLREVLQRPFVQVSGSGMRSTADMGADDVSDFVGDVDLGNLQDPLDMGGMDLGMPPRMPQMNMPGPGESGGGPGGAMLEYWSVEGSDGNGHVEGAQLLTDGEGHTVVNHTHHDHGTDHASKHHDHSLPVQNTRHRSNASNQRFGGASNGHKSNENPSHARHEDARPQQNHYRQDTREEDGRHDYRHDQGREHDGRRDYRHDQSDSEANAAQHQDQQDDRNYQDEKEDRDDRGTRTDDKQNEEPPPHGQHPVIIINNDPKDQGIKPAALVGGLLAIFAQAYLWGNVFVTLFKQQRRPEEAPGSGAPQAATMDRPMAPEQLAPEARRIPPEPHRSAPDMEVRTASTSNANQSGGANSATSSTSASPQQPSQASSSSRFTGASGQPGGAVVQS